MPKLDFDGDIMRQYNDKGILVYEGGYAEYEGETVGVGVAICKSGKGKEYFDDGALKYEGDFKNGKYNGFGILYKDYSLNDRKDYRKSYEGEWNKGDPYGKGILYTAGLNSYNKPDGSNVRKLYEGDFAGGFRSRKGKGKLYGNFNTLWYEGDVDTSKTKGMRTFHGYGKKYYLDTETLEYEGEFKRGKFEGQGKLYTHPEAVLNDKGVYVNKTGEEGKLQYEGTFKNGKLNGYGKEYYTFDGSIRFEGERKDGKRKDGKRYNPSGIIYDGEFNDELQKHGHGKWIRDGVLYYDGDFFEDEIQGKGKLYDKNGVLAYEGDFFEARREGYGKYYEDGKLVYEGERKDGVPLTPREGYDQEKEDKRYEDDLCGRFWGMGTALLEHRKGTIGLG